ncbi:alanine--tRNA ligase [Isachenkonia alkalipeptolytica]|uniref:Alanine--tRNA ligase n=1 Tax=Isachenkonia alkalipeptolytica TaxID=2565777 RepID=A0AA44BD84_9CLOT|nr:alanine--tRNA ligase [Isachenkonia alkalipeptolytica]NBG87628.1 alanine--tRNA ligase [Isachenkonia alkalipeptolytica]
MKAMGANEIRRAFLKFFEEKDHYIQKSYPLVPLEDKSLLLINAGMAPLKPYFSGTKEPPKNRMATCQKCIRTDDIENVGRTARHATFFEMLGNFSFGDYFKKEAIEWSWEFVLEVLEMPRENVWASIYQEDDEAFDLWHDHIGLEKEKIVRLGKEDNFWEIGTGPCGPCSELYYDRGAAYGCEDPDCKPGCDCDRFVEFWNLVFTQFNKDEEGNYTKLPSPNIDTGMGLERVAAIMQDVNSIYEIDVAKRIYDRVIAMKNSPEKEEESTSIKVITDHVKAVTFMIGDGIVPSNEGRGYVLRRLLRRGARHGRMLGIRHSFLKDLMDTVVEIFGEDYPELKEKQDYIRKIITVEEEKFQETIGQGMEILDGYIETLEQKGEKVLSGADAFKLYDTYGFPLDLTLEILAEKNFTVDEEAFEAAMEKQRNLARSSRQKQGTEGWAEDPLKSVDPKLKTLFTGYTSFKETAKVMALVSRGEALEEAVEGTEVLLITDKTPFYGESGGQVGDQGRVYHDHFEGKVLDTQNDKNGRTYKLVKVLSGTVKKGEDVTLHIDEKRRFATMKNHTGTHLLHQALKDVVGDHVNQAGSYVSDERMRFDFNHFEGLTQEEMEKIEEQVNAVIFNGQRVNAATMSLAEAKEKGAAALFTEKYDEHVRVIEVENYSNELCGGSHVDNTSKIGMFKILHEASVASGVRRIEAVTGEGVYRQMKEQEALIQQAAQTLKVKENNILRRIEEVLVEQKDQLKTIESLKSKLAGDVVGDLLKTAVEVKGVPMILENLGEKEMDEIRKIGDGLKEKVESGIIVLGAKNKGKASFIAMVTKDLVQQGIKAGDIVKVGAKVAGGGGGGRPDMAQAGGKNPEKIDEALAAVKSYVEETL